MKNRILSLILILLISIPSFSTVSFADESITKEEMERYLETLVNGEYFRWSSWPFDEYNDAVEEHVMNKNIVLEAFLKVFNDMGSGSYQEAFATMCGQSTFQTKELYGVFEDYLKAVTVQTPVEKMVKDFDDKVDTSKDYVSKAKKIINMADNENLQAETSKIYERTHEMVQDSNKFLGNVSDNLKLASYVNKMICMATDNYAENAKYIDVLCDYVDTEAKSTMEFAEGINDPETKASMKKYAQDMLLAAAEFKMRYHNGYIAALQEIDKALVAIGKNHIKEGVDNVIKSLGANCITSAFKTVDAVFFIKNMILGITGADDKINASSKIQASYPFTLGLQLDFYRQAQERLADKDFSDEDYEYMKTLFELCRGAQTSNYKYLNTQSNEKWIDDALKDLDITKDTHISDGSYIKKYTDYAEGNFNIREDISEIDGAFGGHTYKFITVPMEYTDAIRYCESVGGHLAEIETEEECEYLCNIRNSIDYRKKSFLVKSNNQKLLAGVEGPDAILRTSLRSIASDIENDRYIDRDYYADNGGFVFICEWDGDCETEQTEKRLLRDKGQCGENAFWELTIYGDFRVYGSGSMYNSILSDEDFENCESGRQSLSTPIDIDTSYKKDVKKVIIEEGITSIGYSAFFDYVNLTEVILPETLESIGGKAFLGLHPGLNLKHINIPRGLKYIGKEAFYKCGKLNNIDLSAISSDLKIGNSAFRECSSLENLVMSDNIVYIGEQAFGGCNNLKSVKLSNKLTEIKKNTFFDCGELQSVDIPYGITKIDGAAFFNCSKLSNLTIPESVKTIGDSAGELGVFESSKIEILVFPESVEYLGTDGFDTDALKEVYILNPNCEIKGIHFDYGNSGHRKIYGYENSTAHRWTLSNSKIGNTTFEFIPITKDTVIPGNKNSSDTTDKPELPSPVPTPPSDKDISNSTYDRYQEYINALNAGTDEAMDEYMSKYGQWDKVYSSDAYSNTNEYFIDIYGGEQFGLNYKTAYLDESNMDVINLRDKNHFVKIVPENAKNELDFKCYQIPGDGTGFRFDGLTPGKYTAYITSDIPGSVSNNLAQFNITVHDSNDDVIDEELAEAIDFLRENGVMEGYEDGSFRPHKSMTRAEYAAIVCRYLNNEITFTSQENAFSDVFAEHWGYDYIMTAYEKGLLIGYGGGVFGCDDTLTEEQAITVLCRMVANDVEELDKIELDAKELGGYSMGYRIYADALGIQDIDTESLRNDIPASRETIAKWLYQLYKIKNEL